MSFANGSTKGPQTEDDRGVYTEHLMEGEELRPSNKCLQSEAKFALWIIEYVWAHKMIDILEVLDSSNWPEMDSQPLSLGDSLRLRVGSAQVYFIVRSRNSEHFDTVMDFLETTYRLHPRLVSPIKHMKIMFGLKTTVIMRMLKERRGLVDTMFKINQLFPSKLPQYQDQCSQHQMFLMRKNHQDFKAFVQALVLEKDKLEDYVENQMEDQYGELYAQKVEDRLLDYLLRLESVLPGDTRVDKILKRGSPPTEEEKLLLKVVTSDSTVILKTLKKLLHCDVSCCPDGVSESSKTGETGTESSLNAKSASPGSNSEALLVSEEAKSHHPESDPDVLEDSRLTEEEEEDGGVVKRGEEENIGKAGSSQKNSVDVQRAAASPPQFCSKHQRWVNSILQGCPAECSEELRLQAGVSSSPPLFQSSSGSSSDDLTPSNLNPLPCNQQPPPPHTSAHLHTSGRVDLEDKLDSERPGSGSNASQSEPRHQPTSLRDTQRPGVLCPVVRLIDIASVDTFCTIFEHQQASPNHTQQAPSASSPQILTSGEDATHQKTMKDSTSSRSETLSPKNPPDSNHKVQSASRAGSASTCRSTPVRRSSRVLKRRRPGSTSDVRLDSQTLSYPNSCPLFHTKSHVSGPPTRDAATSTSQSGTFISLRSAGLFRHVTLPNPEPRPGLSIPPDTNRVQRDQLKLSLHSQAVLLQSKLLQPYVSLVRLSRQECDRATERGSWSGDVEQGSSGENPEDGSVEDAEDADSSFDVNFLYFSSSSSDSEDSLHTDPHYKPNIKRRRLLMEYEAARSTNNV